MKNVSEIIRDKPSDKLVYLDGRVTADELSRYLCAMSNTLGGFILIGFKDSTMVSGVELTEIRLRIPKALSMLSGFSSSTSKPEYDSQEFRSHLVIVFQIYPSEEVISANELPYAIVNGVCQKISHKELDAFSKGKYISPENRLIEVKDLVESSSRAIYGLESTLRDSQSLKYMFKNNMIAFLIGLVLTSLTSFLFDLFNVT